MFTFEIRINGALVQHIYGHRLETINDDQTFSYDYEIYDVDTRTVVRGTVNHHYGDGIRTLVKIILEDSLKKEGPKKPKRKSG